MSKRLRPIQLAAVIFLTVSGGPYGLEPLLGYAGKNSALLLLMITPFLWDIPSIFMVLELNSMMPVNGGYYQWVKRALGQRWAFYEGWWTWLYTFVDLAIYPVWFMQYAAFFFPVIAVYTVFGIKLKIIIGLVIIWSSATLNILGIMKVGKASVWLGGFVLVPFLLMFIQFFTHHPGHIALPPINFKGAQLSTTGMALYTVMWNFLGWDNATTYAEEVDKPIRSYLISIAITFCAVFVIYLLTILVAQQSGIDYSYLSENGFPALGTMVGGKWLGSLLALGGMASMLGIFSAVLLSVSRVPKAMAEDRLLPAKLNSLHPKFQTPYISIIICALVVSVMINFKFTELIILDVILYGAGMVLELISLVALRVNEPDVYRPFKIPLNIRGLCVVILLPLTLLIIALSGAVATGGRSFVLALSALAALASAEVGWQIVRFTWRSRKTASDA